MTVVGCTGKPVSEAGEAPAAKKDINIQLYSVRDKILPDFSNLDSLLFQLAEMGYTGVEAAGYNDGKFSRKRSSGGTGASPTTRPRG